MKVTTSILVEQSPARLWPLLCGSRMDADVPCIFRFGIPRPVECRLPNGEGGLGAQRECVSAEGVVRQRITGWEPPVSLRFEMVETNLFFRQCVVRVEEEITLEPSEQGTRMTRTTRVTARGPGRWMKELLLCVGLKQVHRFVFRNWARLAKDDEAAYSPHPGPASPRALSSFNSVPTAPRWFGERFPPGP